MYCSFIIDDIVVLSIILCLIDKTISDYAEFMLDYAEFKFQGCFWSCNFVLSDDNQAM